MAENYDRIGPSFQTSVTLGKDKRNDFWQALHVLLEKILTNLIMISSRPERKYNIDACELCIAE